MKNKEKKGKDFFFVGGKEKRRKRERERKNRTVFFLKEDVSWISISDQWAG